MPHPTTSRYTPAWHNAEDAQERAWLDDWMAGGINPHTLRPYEDTPPSTTAARSHR